jgi:hypothetical protein
VILRCEQGSVFEVKNVAGLKAYSVALRKAAEDFVTKSMMIESPSVDDVLRQLLRAVVSTADTVLFAVDPSYRLLGFSVVLSTPVCFGVGVEAQVSTTYFRPDRPHSEVAALTLEAIRTVAQRWGSPHITMCSNLPAAIWAKHGFLPISTVYQQPTERSA